MTIGSNDGDCCAAFAEWATYGCSFNLLVAESIQLVLLSSVQNDDATSSQRMLLAWPNKIVEATDATRSAVDGAGAGTRPMFDSAVAARGPELATAVIDFERLWVTDMFRFDETSITSDLSSMQASDYAMMMLGLHMLGRDELQHRHLTSDMSEALVCVAFIQRIVRGHAARKHVWFVRWFVRLMPTLARLNALAPSDLLTRSGQHVDPVIEKRKSSKIRTPTARDPARPNAC